MLYRVDVRFARSLNGSSYKGLIQDPDQQQGNLYSFETPGGYRPYWIRVTANYSAANVRLQMYNSSGIVILSKRASGIGSVFMPWTTSIQTIFYFLVNGDPNTVYSVQAAGVAT